MGRPPLPRGDTDRGPLACINPGPKFSFPAGRLSATRAL